MGCDFLKQNKPEIERFCKFCERASALTDPDVMLCRHKGVVSAAHVCRKFLYDPLKREPSAPVPEVTMEYVDL